MISTGEELIQFTISKFTTTMPTRETVLHHLFFVSGNGFRWDINGCVDLTTFANVSDVVLDRGTLTLFQSIKEEYKTYNISTFDQQIDVQIDFKKKYFDFIEENIQDISMSDFSFFEANSPAISFMDQNLSEYCLFFSPKQVAPEWHYLMVEAAQSLIKRYEKASYTKLSHDYYNDSNWINVGHLNVVRRINEHLNNISIRQ